MQNAIKQACKRTLEAKFRIGALVMTQGVSELMKEHGLEPLGFVSRHIVGDWGELPDEDKEANENSITNGGRIFSAYDLFGFPEKRLWVITEADRSCTTILLPSEY